MKLKCRHCCKKPVNRPKLLCWVCYYTPGVKEMYGPVSNYGNRADPHGMRQSKPASEACPHPPWSEERLRTLAGRAERGESMVHPNDRRG